MAAAVTNRDRSVLSTARQWAGVALVAAVTGVGTLWYWLVEDFSVVDALYQSVITISTVGFGEISPLDTSGRLFTIGLIVVGVATVVYTLGGFVGMLIDSSVDRISSRRKERSLERLNDHVVICGYGRVGEEVARLLPSQRRVGVIDIDPERAATAQSHGLLVIEGDCTTDETLIDAGIDRAERMIVCLASDGDAISTVLSARTLRPDLQIVSRANAGSTSPKLRMAGANHVVSPIEMAAQRLVGDALDPSIGSFLDAALHDATIALSIRGAACHRHFDEAEILDIEHRSGARVVGIHTPTGAVSARGRADKGHLLIAAGHEDELNAFTVLVTGAN